MNDNTQATTATTTDTPRRRPGPRTGMKNAQKPEGTQKLKPISIRLTAADRQRLQAVRRPYESESQLIRDSALAEIARREAAQEAQK